MSLKHRFFHFVLPSMLAMLVFNLYTMVDGIFVAHYVGETALAAVNLVMPFINFIFALSLFLSMGTSTLVSILRGKGEIEKANGLFSQNTLLLIMISLLLTLICFLFLDRLASFLGATQDTMAYVQPYLGTILLFSGFFILSYYLEVLIKADGYPGLATVGMVLGAFTNLSLDYLFLAHLNGGIQGAAIATGIAQVLTFLIFSSHFLFGHAHFHWKHFTWDFSIYRRIFVLGFADFITELSAGSIVYIFNQVILAVMGTAGVISYTVIGYVYNLVLMAMVGITQGVQPLISFFVGQQDGLVIRTVFRYALALVGLLSVGITGACLFMATPIVRFFIRPEQAELTVSTVYASRLYSLIYLFMGINILVSGFCAACAKGREAWILSLSRGCFVIIVVLFGMTAFFEELGIWLSPFVSEGLVLLICIPIIQNSFDKKWHVPSNSSIS